MVYEFFDKKISGSAAKSEIMLSQQLAEELHKSLIRKTEKRKVYSPFIDNILGADLADMQLINTLNKGFPFLFCVIDIYSKYTWVVPKKVITITNAFQKILDNSGRKPNKMWIDKDSELPDNDTEMIMVAG